jgi:hypothetical protein
MPPNVGMGPNIAMAPTASMFGGGLPPATAPLFGGLSPQPVIPGGGSGFSLGTPPAAERSGSDRRVRRARRPPK